MDGLSSRTRGGGVSLCDATLRGEREPGEGGGTARTADDRDPDDDDPATRADLASMDVAIEGEIPIGWYEIGTKKDVPTDACHVGRYGDCYVWVMPEWLGGLPQFSLLILSIVELDTMEGQGGEV